MRDINGAMVMENGKPKIEDSPIELAAIIEKHLDPLGSDHASKLTLNRIGLINNNGTGPISMPDFNGTPGFTVIQPFCGTLGKDAASTLACPQ